MAQPSDLEKEILKACKKMLMPTNEMMKKDPAKATAILEEALEYFHGDDQIINQLGHLYEQQFQVQKAAELYEKSRFIQSNAHFAIKAAKAYFQMWKFDKAESILKESIQREPGVSEFYFALADYYLLSGDFRVNDLNKYFEWMPADAATPARKLDKAILVLKTGLNRMPNDTGKRLFQERMGYIYFKENDLENSLIYRRLCAEGGREINRWRDLGEVLLKLNKPVEGIEAYKKAHSFINKPTAEDFCILSNAYFDVRLFEESRKMLISADQLNLGDNYRFLRWGDWYFKQGKFADAARTYEEGAMRCHNVGPPYLLKKHFNLETASSPVISPYIIRSLDFLKDNLLYNAGNSYYNAGDNINASRVFHQMIDEDSGLKDSAIKKLASMGQY